MTPGRYRAEGPQAEFQPGSRGRVLRNRLGIERVRAMQQAESDALLAVQEWAIGHFSAEHRFGGRAPRWAEGSESETKAKTIPIVTEHPVVRVHPVTGARILFVTPGFTSRVVGLSARQSDRLLDLLFAEISDPAYTVRIRWTPDSLGIWDNRATAHQAPTDLDHLDVVRVLYRTTIEGDVPVGVDGRSSRSISGDPFLAERTTVMPRPAPQAIAMPPTPAQELAPAGKVSVEELIDLEQQA